MKQCCSDLSVIRKMQITTKVTYRLILKPDNGKC